MRYGGDFKKSDPVHVDGAKNPSSRQKLTTENQQQFNDKKVKIESYIYNKKTYNLKEIIITNKEMRR
jgi:folylpolyglutamate synthase/dihydropteroate synthase